MHIHRARSKARSGRSAPFLRRLSQRRPGESAGRHQCTGPGSSQALFRSGFLHYFVEVTGLTPNNANIHLGAPSTTGPIIGFMSPSSLPNFYFGAIQLSLDEAVKILNGEGYVNISTNANPDGEIRCNLQPMLRQCFTFDLCGDQEVPLRVRCRGRGCDLCRLSQHPSALSLHRGRTQRTCDGSSTARGRLRRERVPAGAFVLPNLLAPVNLRSMATSWSSSNPIIPA
ncbi:MAG: CHRD domain-containing protein [Saprospirales bacterium]|nr:CHRD domain-containing protein [Saprospirales bacterium]